MSTWKINFKEQTATSINGITFKLTETKQGEYEGVCLNPKDIPPDDLDSSVNGNRTGLYLAKEVLRPRMFNGVGIHLEKCKNMNLEPYC